MSSIDKYIKDMSDVKDLNMKIERANGRIKGFVKGVKVFDISDRIAYENSFNVNEKLIIDAEIKRFKENQAKIDEEKKARIAQLKRIKKMEAKRDNAINDVISLIGQKTSTIGNILKSLNDSLNNKKNEITMLEKEIEEIKKKFPNGNYSELISIREQLSSHLESSYSKKINEIEAVESKLNHIKDIVKKKKTFEEVSICKSDVEKMVIPSSIEGFALDTSLLKNKIKIFNDSITQLNVIINESSFIKDKFIQTQIENDLSEINLLDKEHVAKVISSIKDKIDKYRSKLSEQEIINQINKIRSLEGKLTNIEKMYVFNASDNYTIKDNSKEIYKKANELLNEFTQLSSYEYKVLDFDYKTIFDELYKLTNNPEYNARNLKFLDYVSDQIFTGWQKIKQNEASFKLLKELREELEDYGLAYQKPFDYFNFQGQKIEIIKMIVDEIHASEISTIYNTSYEIMSSMENIGYEFFGREIGEYYQEIYFYNKKYPGVLTRFLIDTDGSFRRSLVCVRINDQVTKVEQAVKYSAEMENDVLAFIKDYTERYHKKIGISQMTNYNDADANQQIISNGYINLEGESAELYNSVFNNTKNNNNNNTQMVNIFEDYKVSSIRAADTSKAKEDSRLNSSSYKREMELRVK